MNSITDTYPDGMAENSRSESPPRSLSRSNFVNHWLSSRTTEEGRHTAILLSERECQRGSITTILDTVLRDHYFSDETWAGFFDALGASETAQAFRETLPTTKQARSADIGEIFATEIAEQTLQYKIPIRKLQWKDGRNVPLRGDDLIAISEKSDGTIKFLKGEAKSRRLLRAQVVTEAADYLDKGVGRPSRFSIVFIARELFKRGEIEQARIFLQALRNSFASNELEHLLFVVSGNDPSGFLIDHLSGMEQNAVKRFAIGLRISDHADFIAELYDRQ